jgi:multidrug efflux pump subunit AcrA (membrane-fusion protein)
VNSFLNHKYLLVTVCALLVVSSTHFAQADDEKPEQKTQTVLEQSLTIVLELDGTAVAEEMIEVAVAPQRWTTWTVDEAVAHGVHVRKGDVLVRFDTTKLDEAIADLEAELELTNLTIAQADQELPLFEKTLAMDTADAERAHRINTEDTQHYLDVEKALALKSTKFSLKSSQQYY